MGNHTISKDEREQEFPGIKENRSYIFNPMEASGFHGVNSMDLQLRFTRAADYLTRELGGAVGI